MTGERIKQEDVIPSPHRVTKKDLDTEGDGDRTCLEFSPVCDQRLSCLSQDGSLLAGADKFKLIIRDAETLEVLHLCVCVGRIDRLQWASPAAAKDPSSSFDKRGHRILSACYKEATVEVWEIQPGGDLTGQAAVGRAVQLCRLSEGSVLGLSWCCWAPDCRNVVTVSEFQVRLTVWDVHDRTSVSIRDPKIANQRGIAFSSSGRYLAVLQRQDCRDWLAVLDCYDKWATVQRIGVETSDAREILWLHYDLHLAVVERALEYKVVVYSLMGHRVAAFALPGGEFAPCVGLGGGGSPRKRGRAEREKGGGLLQGGAGGDQSPESGVLGIFCAERATRRPLLAVGSRDNAVRLLDTHAWLLSRPLQHSQVISPWSTSTSMSLCRERDEEGQREEGKEEGKRSRHILTGKHEHPVGEEGDDHGDETEEVDTEKENKIGHASPGTHSQRKEREDRGIGGISGEKGGGSAGNRRDAEKNTLQEKQIKHQIVVYREELINAEGDPVLTDRIHFLAGAAVRYSVVDPHAMHSGNRGKGEERRGGRKRSSPGRPLSFNAGGGKRGETAFAWKEGLLQLPSVSTQTGASDLAASGSYPAGLMRGASQIVWSPDDNLIATRCDELPTVCWVWDVDTLRPLSVLVHRKPVRDLCWDPSGDGVKIPCRLAICTGSSEIFLWQRRGAAVAALPSGPERMKCHRLQFSHDGKKALILDRESVCVCFLEQVQEVSQHSQGGRVGDPHDHSESMQREPVAGGSVRETSDGGEAGVFPHSTASSDDRGGKGGVQKKEQTRGGIEVGKPGRNQTNVKPQMPTSWFVSFDVH